VVVVAVVLILIAGLAWVARGRRAPRSDAEARALLAARRPAPADLNLVVVTLDTLRADRLGCYGFAPTPTPHIDALARDGVVFEQATATVPLTLPSHSSIFTGLVPPRHGVRDNGGFFLEDSKTTLAEVLKQAGYATGAFVGAWVLDSKWGLAQGFDRYADKFDLSKLKVVSLGTVQKPGDQVMDEALAWLESVRAGRFFAWVHLYDPHTPYAPPEPYLSRYSGQRYLGEVAYTDHVVGRLLEWLRASGLERRTLVVLTADHGESLGEHGEATHAYFVYDSTMHVPLIVRTPWGERGRSRAQVSSVDVLPTILDLLGRPPLEAIDGRSLARSVLDPSVDPGHVAYSETYFPRYHFGWQHLRRLRDGRYSFVDAPVPELYDLADDPQEARNLHGTRAARAQELRTRLQALAGSGAGSPERRSLDPETLQRLAALGYVGSAADVDPDAVLPDPKEKLPIFARLGAAKALAQEDKHEQAIAQMREVIALDPGIIDAHVTLANWLRRVGKRDEAVAALKAALSIQPDNELALENLASVYRALGRHEAAIEGYRSVLELEPRNPQTWYQLATLFLDLGRVADAQATFRSALEHNPKMGAAYNSLGAIALARGDPAEAERLVRRGLELEPEVRTGRYNLARLIELRGDGAGAEALYREELEVYPDHGKARFNLAQLLKQRGDRAGYLRELQASVEQAPEFGPSHFFLAREELDAGRLDLAAELSQRGLRADPASELAPLGHYVLADVFNRRGDDAQSRLELEKARRLEAALKRRASPRI
jgi:arylsulfatase A-like enzyme/Tfp pilus assembly protein PilF